MSGSLTKNAEIPNLCYIKGGKVQLGFHCGETESSEDVQRQRDPEIQSRALV